MINKRPSKKCEMKIVNFNLKNFEDLKDKKWMLGNNVLYKLCSDYPNHTNPEEIRAKIWLIGRSYAASIERRSKINKRHINDDFYDYVVQEFIKFNLESNFDEKIENLRNKDFSEQTLPDILSIHKELTDFFKELTGKEKRSLASKYLHFHIPLFPIYDSRASNSLNLLVKGQVKKTLWDEQYSKFCNKLLLLYESIKSQTGKSPTLREIDTFLIKNANDKLNKSLIDVN